MQAWVIGNWKQNPATLQAAKTLLDDTNTELKSADLAACRLMVVPSLVHVSSLQQQETAIAIGAQDISAHSAETGAFTGDCSAAQVRDAGATWVLVGHSERRQYYGEDEATLYQKVKNALSQQLGVIFCVGETKEQYDSEQTFSVLTSQLTVIEQLLAESNEESLAERLIIAYEPVWAIGTGKVPTVEEVAATHTHIKAVIQGYAGAEAALGEPCVLYGGSVNAANAAQFAQADSVNGALVGGAALQADSFLAIAAAFSTAKSNS